MGKNMVFVPECHSTNSLALEMSQKRDLVEGTLIITGHQTQGRGQRGNAWLSEHGKNLTFSLVLRPAMITIADQFTLNMAVSVGIRSFLEGALNRPVYIKWPNDILVDDLKVCGILIENQIQGNSLLQSIVGIGLNVNQSVFSIAHAASMQMLMGREYDLNEILETLCASLEQWYLMLSREPDKIKEAYHASLYGLNAPRNFSTPQDRFEGVIRGVDAQGRLTLATSSGIRHFRNRELKFEY